MNSSELKGFLTGLIIGDGHIDKGITKRALRIKSINYEFIQMIYEQLSKCTQFKLGIREIDAYTSNGVNHKMNWELVVFAHPYFAKKYHHFYDDNAHRIVSKLALNWITPYGLANWYMSDGYICLVGKEKGRIYNRRMEISTDRYSYKTVEKLCKMLFDRFGVVASIIKRGKRYRIRIKTESYATFINLIEPYMVDSMKYKLYLGYNSKPKWMDDEMWSLQQYLRSATALTGYAEGYDIV